MSNPALRDQFERILLISEDAAASLAEQVMEVFTEKEEQAQQQQQPGRCPSLLEAISFLKAGSFARGEGGRARQPGSRLAQRTQKGPDPTRLWALESQRAHCNRDEKQLVL